ncbi:MAG: hypothetical protein RLZZ292_815 [Bacteroidota bacterium]|jgi:glutaredoxin
MLKIATQLLDFLQLDHAYQHLTARLKGQTRSLTEEEMALGKSIFGENIDYQVIRIDEHSHTAQRLRAKYVSFNTINSWGKMSPDVFIHELVHIWQYQRLGSVYIAEALAAQRSEAGYNYGGIAALQKALEEGKTLRDFNFEQQGDIVQDYYLITHGYRAQWGTARQKEAPIYWEIIEKGLKNT